MKKLLIGLLVLTSISAFAGELINRSSQEKIVFTVSEDNKSIEVASTRNSLPSTIYIDSVDRGRTNTNYFAVTDARIELMRGDGELFWNWVPINVVNFTVMIGAHASDLVLAPFKGVISLVKNGKYKKDYKVLIKAINTDATFEVGNKRFNRILKLIKN